MKKTILIISLAAIVSFGIFACSSPSKKVENAEENLIEAKEELKESKRDSIADYEAFKEETEARINNNESIIAAYKERMASDKSKVKEADQKMIDEIEQRNIDMRKKMREYKENGKDGWEAFKNKFNGEMDELSNSMKGLSGKNNK